LIYLTADPEGWEEASRATKEGMVIRVRVKPNSPREGVEGVVNGRLVVRVKAPPTEGRANSALTRLLSGEAGVPPSAIEVIRGFKSRDKTLLFKGWYSSGAEG
jgi:hypothetical protein